MATKVYGNYCGPGWTGGQLVRQGQPNNYNIAPIDQLDALCRLHDIAYESAENFRNAGDIGSYWQQIISADQSLLRDNGLLIGDLLRQIDNSTDPVLRASVRRELDMARNVQGAFVLKEKYFDIPNRNSAPLSWEAQQALDLYLWELFPYSSGLPSLAPDPLCNTNFTAATNWRQSRDPLAIDLDADGIETLGIPADGSTPTLFDHNADGIRTGTGWLRPDDAWLVLDRDANGTIDTGRELFGVDTRIIETFDISGTTYTFERNARTGFEALRALDANADDRFDAVDAAFSQVRLWQDANGDGISQATELSTLADKGIVRIALTESATSTNLGNGNSITGTATVTRANGSSTLIDSVDLTAGNLNLAENGFYREFTDTIAWTTTARALPEMRGSGWVRDMREAMSLGTAAGDGFAQVMGGFAAAQTREAQHSQLAGT